MCRAWNNNHNSNIILFVCKLLSTSYFVRLITTFVYMYTNIVVWIRLLQVLLAGVSDVPEASEVE